MIVNIYPHPSQKYLDLDDDNRKFFLSENKILIKYFMPEEGPGRGAGPARARGGRTQ